MSETNPVGRPCEYTPEISDRICAGIANGKSLRTILKADNMPGMSTVFEWLRKFPEFAEQYARARDAQADALADEIQDIADDGSNDYMEELDKKTGECIGWRQNGEAAQRSRLRVDARKWIASKLKPKRYGDKLDVEHTGKVSLEQLIAQSGLKKPE